MPNTSKGFEEYRLLGGVSANKEQGSDQEEVSDEELFALLAEHPLGDGYVRKMDPYILPLSIEDTYEAFYANEAPYFLDSLVRYLGDKSTNLTDWGPLPEDAMDSYKSAFGFDTIEQRTHWSYLKFVGVPFVDYSDIESYIQLLFKNETQLVLRAIDKSHGIPYADTFETHTKWEIYSAAPGSNKVIVGHSMRVVWFEKPMVAGIIEDATFNKLEDAKSGITRFYVDKARDYATLKSIEKSKNAEMIRKIVEENAKRSEERQIEFT